MIVFRYTKTDGAEYVSHLDTLRHLNKTFIRSGIPVKKSAGFHPHQLVYMSSPIGVGLKSLAEYCSVDTDISADSFKELFNEFSPRGIKCVNCFYTEKNINLAAVIDRAEYEVLGLNPLDTEEILKSKEFFITDKRGVQKEVRGKIFSLENTSEGFKMVIAAGNNALRPDCFVDKLKEIYGGGSVSIIKTLSFTGNGITVEEFAEQKK